MGIDLSGSTPVDPSRPKGIIEMIQDALSAPGGIGAILAAVVTGIVGGLVGAVQGISGLIGGLFSLGRQDMAAVDQARAAAENAIVNAMSDSLEHLDEIQRFGGAYMDYPTFRIFNGEVSVRVLPLSAYVPLAAGTRFIPPAVPLTHSENHQYSQGESESVLAQGSGQLELMESGLWLIYFQGSFVQGSGYTDRPVHMWCHVTPAESPWLPVGPPGLLASGASIPGEQMARHRETGAYDRMSLNDVVGYGRAAAYVRTQVPNMGGGNTLFGMAYAYLEEGGYKVSLSDMSFRKFGGAAATFVTAQKVNSETLRQDIDQMKLDIAAALPGQNVDLLMDEAAIAAMVAEAEAIDVLSEVPDE